MPSWWNQYRPLSFRVKTITSAPRRIVLVLKPFPSAISVKQQIIFDCPKIYGSILFKIRQYTVTVYVLSTGHRSYREGATKAMIRHLELLTLANCCICVFAGVAQAHALSNIIWAHATSIICKISTLRVGF